MGQGFEAFSRFIPLCVLLFLVSVLIGFGIGFPTDVLRERLVREISLQTGMVASSEFLELGFPAQVEFDLTLDTNLEQIVPLDFKQVQVQPVWSSLFSGGRSAALEGQFSDGSIEAQIGADDHLQLELRGVQLGPLQKLDNPYRLNGVLSGQFDGQQVSHPKNTSSVFTAEISELELFGLESFSLPASIALGQLSVQGKMNGQRLNLENISLKGDFAGLNGNGTIQIGTSPRQTRLNLRMTMIPGQSFPESLKPLVEMSGVKPKPDGSYQFRIAGTLAAPVLR